MNFIHDEVIVEVPSDRAEKAKEAITQIMVEAMSGWITRVPIQVEARITERWQK